MQTGISFAVGQLLAVVAPRTVLVVDAPTDWSLAGPLWELALDDAPVDEILDVLIRRGIRTAPSFAIVRVENEAVRALVRGSVPVCFERAGEPVRLDATGATSWLEGLISGARRVLVGAVDASTPMPYLVSTGVVLVSGLALPTGVDAEERTSPSTSTAQPGGETDRPGSAPAPVPAAASLPGRVVDLTRSASRTPVRSFAGESSGESQGWPLDQRSSDPSPEPSYPALNGHAPAAFAAPSAPAVTEPDQPVEDLSLSEAPAELQPEFPADLRAEPVVPADLSVEAAPAPPVPSVLPVLPEPADSDSPAEQIARSGEPFAPHDPFAPPIDVRSPAREQAPSFDALVSPAEGLERTEVLADRFGSADAPVVDRSTEGYRPFGDDEADVQENWSEPPPSDHSDDDQPDDQPDRHADRHGEVDSSDLLVDVEPVGPSPADLPTFDPPSLSLPLPNLGGTASPVNRYAPGSTPRFDPPSYLDSPSTGLGAPAAWPPPFPREHVNGTADARTGYQNPFAQPEGFSAPGAFEAPQPAPEPTAEPEALNGRAVDEIDDADDVEQFRAGPSTDERETAGEAPSETSTDVPGVPEARQAEQLEPAESVDDADASEPAVLRLEERPADAEIEEGAHPVGMLDRDHVPDDLSGVRGAGDDDRDSEPDFTASDAETEGREDDALPSLPFRVRGQSLRPEQREPLRSPAEPDGYVPDDPPLIPSPEGIPLPSRPVAPAGAGQRASAGAAPMSGSLLLPAFFRGARAARTKPPAPVAPSAREGLRPAAPSTPGAPGDASRPQTPSNWQPPVRRAFPDRSPAGGPPAMPGVLRTGGGGAGTSSPAFGVPGADVETEADPSTPSGGRPVEPPREPPRLLGVWCDAGHVTSPDRPECRVCGLPVPPQAPILVARPPLGVLVFDNGDRVVVDRPVILGRDPKPVSSPDPEAPVLHPVQSATGQVSRTHAEVRASGWDVVITDLEAMNGTALTVPGASPVAIEPGVPTVLGSGARVDLGGESGFVFEIEG